jgi:hypothetical protein
MGRNSIRALETRRYTARLAALGSGHPCKIRHHKQCKRIAQFYTVTIRTGYCKRRRAVAPPAQELQMLKLYLGLCKRQGSTLVPLGTGGGLQQ